MRADRVVSPSMHIHYGSRVADAVDDLPRHVGGAASQAVFGAGLMRGMWATRGTASTR